MKVGADLACGIIGAMFGALAAAMAGIGGPHWMIVAASMGVFVFLGRLRANAAPVCGHDDRQSGLMADLARHRHSLIGGLLLSYIFVQLYNL